MNVGCSVYRRSLPLHGTAGCAFREVRKPSIGTGNATELFGGAGPEQAGTTVACGSGVKPKIPGAHHPELLEPF